MNTSNTWEPAYAVSLQQIAMRLERGVIAGSVFAIDSRGWLCADDATIDGKERCSRCSTHLNEHKDSTTE